MAFIHELSAWPAFRWEEAGVSAKLAQVRFEQGRLLGRFVAAGFETGAMVDSIVANSAIEGETLDREQVRSSIDRRTGMSVAGLPKTTRNVEALVEITLDATGSDAPLTAARLWKWQGLLFPGREGWRDDTAGQMVVKSGPIGRERIHFEAPASDRLQLEMAQFINWFNSDGGLDEVIMAALAHLYFVTLHPFEDGNGRIARVLSDMRLARSDRTEGQYYSMAAAIMNRRKSYYAVLESTQRGNLDVTEWLHWFLDTLSDAMAASESVLRSALSRAEFWRRHAGLALSKRQIKALNSVIDGLDVPLTTAKWAKLAGISRDTALRDLNQLVDAGILVRSEAGGRSTVYHLT